MMWFSYLAVSVVTILAGVAIYYHVLLYKKNRTLASTQSLIQAELEKRRHNNKRSVEIIARAVIDEQVTLTEASIRINTLLQSLELNSETREALCVFRQLAEATAHIPILDRWKALPKKQKQAYDVEREQIEAQFRDFVIAAAKKISHEKILEMRLPSEP